jgi:hypothetical protein
MCLALPALERSFLRNIIRWIITRLYNVFVYVLLSLALFPNFVLDSLNDGVMNWYQFFFSELPLYLNTTWKAVVWLKDKTVGYHENFVDQVNDWDSHITLTEPSAFHDTFGDLLGHQ